MKQKQKQKQIKKKEKKNLHEAARKHDLGGETAM